MRDFAILVEPAGLDALRQFDDLPAKIELAAQRAVNRIADKGRTKADREIRSQVAFPASYTSASSGRLSVSRRASKGHLEAAIRAQGRATSLARFATKVNKEGATVMVKPGLSRFLPKAFLVRLNQGSSHTDTRFNKGLAIRLKPGDTLRNKKNAVKLAKGLYLLYGPSVQQAFVNNAGGGVALDISPGLADALVNEFDRLVDLDG